MSQEVLNRTKWKMPIKFQNIGHSDLVLLVCLGLVQMDICVKFDNYDLPQRQDKLVSIWKLKKKGCHLKITCQIVLIFHVHIPGTYVHTVARYEVSTNKHMNKRTVHKWQCHANDDDDNARQTIHDYIFSSEFMPNEPTSWPWNDLDIVYDPDFIRTKLNGV